MILKGESTLPASYTGYQEHSFHWTKKQGANKSHICYKNTIKMHIIMQE